MADIEATISSETPAATAPAAKSPKVKKAKAVASAAGVVKKPKSKSNHPPTSEMVQSAIKALKERSGSSLQAIKKYISATYKIDADKLSPFIKKYLKNAVISGQLVQTKGKGASGSFKISAALKPKAPKKSIGDKPKAAAAKKAVPKKVATGSDKKPKAVAKKVAAVGSAKKVAAAAAKKPASDKKKAAVATAKSVKKTGVKSAPKQKPTKPTKADAAKKPKTPKPKRSAPKKAAAKK